MAPRWLVPAQRGERCSGLGHTAVIYAEAVRALPHTGTNNEEIKMRISATAAVALWSLLAGGTAWAADRAPLVEHVRAANERFKEVSVEVAGG